MRGCEWACEWWPATCPGEGTCAGTWVRGPCRHAATAGTEAPYGATEAQRTSGSCAAGQRPWRPRAGRPSGPAFRPSVAFVASVQAFVASVRAFVASDRASVASVQASVASVRTFAASVRAFAAC